MRRRREPGGRVGEGPKRKEGRRNLKNRESRNILKSP